MTKPAATNMLHAVWKEAYAKGEVTLNFQSKSEATQIRFMLYNTAKSVKTGPKGQDFELEDAVENCSISVQNEGKTLVIRQKALMPLLQSVAAQLGLEVPQPNTAAGETAAEAEESLRRLQERLEGGGVSKRKNPYY